MPNSSALDSMERQDFIFLVRIHRLAKCGGVIGGGVCALQEVVWGGVTGRDGPTFLGSGLEYLDELIGQ